MKDLPNSDFYKLVAYAWQGDRNCLSEKEFSKKWKIICREFNMELEYTDKEKTNISDETVRNLLGNMIFYLKSQEIWASVRGVTLSKTEEKPLVRSEFSDNIEDDPEYKKMKEEENKSKS